MDKYGRYGSQTQSSSNKALSIMLTIVLVGGGLVILYYLYKFLYGAVTIQSTTVVPGTISGIQPPTNIPSIPALYEGGDYSVSTWVYINSYNVNRNTRKHIFEIGGSNFSTLLVGLGAFKNNLVVRTHSRDGDNAVTALIKDNSGNSISSSVASTQTPSAQQGTLTDSSLTPSDLDALFTPLAMDDTLLDSNTMCDLPTIDMQRWVLVTVVLSGRIIDVYLDGKLARSCVSASYYKVDGAGVTMKVLKHGGFDGNISNLMTYNYSLSPSEIYNIYLNGPTGSSTSVFTWLSTIFTGGSA